MGYAETRLQRGIQQLKAEAKKAKVREQQTRQGSLELLHALKELVASAAGLADTSSAKANQLVAQAELLLAPDPDPEVAPEPI